MIELGIFIVLGVVILILFECRARKQKSKAEGDVSSAENAEIVNNDGECCGQHLVCERESLLQTNTVPEYYDDEDLDQLAGISPEQYSQAQIKTIREVFDTLQEKDVAGWCRSLQLRHIELPQDIREEALLIVRERRQQA